MLRPGATATAADIIEYVGARLARFKRPKVVEFVDRVPRLAPGAGGQVGVVVISPNDVGRDMQLVWRGSI